MCRILECVRSARVYFAVIVVWKCAFLLGGSWQPCRFCSAFAAWLYVPYSAVIVVCVNSSYVRLTSKWFLLTKSRSTAKSNAHGIIISCVCVLTRDFAIFLSIICSFELLMTNIGDQIRLKRNGLAFAQKVWHRPSVAALLYCTVPQ